jgi:predicted ATPase
MAPHIQGVTVNTDNFPTEEYYPFNLEVIRNTRFIDLDTPVTLLVGENGSGKSTFLEALARRCDIHIWRSEHGARYQTNIWGSIGSMERFREASSARIISRTSLSCWMTGHLPIPDS